VFCRLSTAYRAGGVREFNHRKSGGPAAAVVEPLFAGRGRDQIVALPLVNAVFANEVRKLRQKLPKPVIFLDERVGFVAAFVAAKGGLIPAECVLE
jgi:hypothetical protein